MRARLTAGGLLVALLVSSCDSNMVGSSPTAEVDEVDVEAKSTLAPGRSINDGGSASVVRRLAAYEARRRGLADRDETRKQLAAIREAARVREESLLRDALYQSIRGEVELSEEELRDYYDRTWSRHTERQVRLRRQRFSTLEGANSRKEALGPKDRLDGEGIETIGPLPVSRLPREILPEALRLQAPLDRAIAGRDGEWWLLELDSVHPAEPLPFDEVRSAVENGLRTERAKRAVQELIDRLRSEAS